MPASLRLLVVVAAIALAGCVTPARSPWVKSPGGGPIDVTVKELPVGDATTGVPAIRSTSPRPPMPAVPPRAQLPRVETADAGLRAALEALAAQPTAAAQIQVAREYHRLRVFDDAIAHFDAALALEQRNGEAYDGRARVWRDSGLLGQAIADASRAVFFSPSSPAFRNTLGTVLEALGQFDSARGAYEIALSLDARAAYAENNLRELPSRAARRASLKP